MNLLQGRKCVSEMINWEKFADDEQQILEINRETRQFISLVKLVCFVFLLLVSLFWRKFAFLVNWKLNSSTFLVRIWNVFNFYLNFEAIMQPARCKWFFALKMLGPFGQVRHPSSDYPEFTNEWFNNTQK